MRVVWGVGLDVPADAPAVSGAFGLGDLFYDLISVVAALAMCCRLCHPKPALN